MRTGALMTMLALGLQMATGCARLPRKPPDIPTRNRLQIQAYPAPPAQTFANYTRALTEEKYKVDNTHQSQGMIVGRMKGGQIKRDIFVGVIQTAGGSQARMSVQQTQPFDLTTEQGREYFYPPIYQRIYKRLNEPSSVATAPAAVATPAMPSTTFYKKSGPARTPAHRQ